MEATINQERFTHKFPTANTDYWLNSSLKKVEEIVNNDRVILLVDEQVFRLHRILFDSYTVIRVPSGEAHKSFDTVISIAQQLHTLEADKHSIIVGVGGGVLTDITGFVASIYMRGVRFGFIPTTLLAMVDAAIGGKNGINLGLFKNQLGLIRQPAFVLYDLSLLTTLPQNHWASGMAEVIKYGCIMDEPLLLMLHNEDITSLRQELPKLNIIIKRCLEHKNQIVCADEQESGLRKLLNFGHTSGHAFEILYQLSHGQAVALGILVACILSEIHTELDLSLRPSIARLIQQYGLSTVQEIDVEQVLAVVKGDKKRNKDYIDYVLLNKAGAAQVKALSFEQIKKALLIFADEYRP